jgi:hypothetical protein
VAGIRGLFARHLLPLSGAILTAGINAAYAKWPVLEAVAPDIAVHASLSGILAGLFFYLDPWLKKDAPYFVQPPRGDGS